MGLEKSLLEHIAFASLLVIAVSLLVNEHLIHLCSDFSSVKAFS